jgi:succinoglycan biosynthesis transport protein ExoP
MNGRESRGEGGERYLSALRRGLPIVVITTVVVTALAIGLSLRQGALYEGTAEVFVTNGTVTTSIAGFPASIGDPERNLATQAAVASTLPVAQIAVKKAGVPGVSPSELLSESSVTPNSSADILDFSVTSGNADTARKLADGYVEGYKTYRTQQDLGKIRRARKGVEQQINDLEASSHPDTQLLTNLQGQDQTLRTAELSTGGSVTVGGPAGASQTQPLPARNGFIGGILGIVLGIALVFVRDALNTRVRSTGEIEERLGMPLLSRIPPPHKRHAEAHKLSTLEEPHTVPSEAYRMLATNIELLNLDRGASSIMISSPMHAEGKSTTAGNLAVSFARRGFKVVLLEADLRRPSLREFFGLESGPGLADVAVGGIELNDALVSVPLPVEEGEGNTTNGAGSATGELELLVGGMKPPSPAEFLKTHAVADIVARLTERSDLLLIDTPPLLHVTDPMTMMLAANIDCLILGARLGVVRRQALAETKRLLDSAPIVKLGFFATGAATTEGYGGYGYGSYYYSRESSPSPSEQPKGRATA